jgi:hypothetical protein
LQKKEKVMARTFSISTAEDPATLVDRAKRVASENGAAFEGDVTSGSFSGSGVKGEYKIEDRTVTVTITDKPFFLSWDNVESRVKGFFH